MTATHTPTSEMQEIITLWPVMLTPLEMRAAMLIPASDWPKPIVTQARYGGAKDYVKFTTPIPMTLREYRAQLKDIIRKKLQTLSDGERVLISPPVGTGKRMFNLARQWEIVKENPCQGVEMFPERQTKAEYLTPEECRALIEAAEPYFRPVLITAIHTGLRRGELLGLTWDRVDLGNRIIRLDEGKTVKTEPEYVPIDDTVAEALSRLPRYNPRLFHRVKGAGPLKDVRKPFSKALEASGIAEKRRREGKPRLRFHDLRHTTASNMVMAGLSLEAAQKMLRHKDIRTTQRYAHLSPDFMKKAADRLDEYLSTDTKTDTVGETQPVRDAFAMAKNPL